MDILIGDWYTEEIDGEKTEFGKTCHRILVCLSIAIRIFCQLLTILFKLFPCPLIRRLQIIRLLFRNTSAMQTSETYEITSFADMKDDWGFIMFPYNQKNKNATNKTIFIISMPQIMASLKFCVSIALLYLPSSCLSINVASFVAGI